MGAIDVERERDQEAIQRDRYAFNVQLKVAHPASDTFQVNDITRLIGVRTAANGGPQYICSFRDFRSRENAERQREAVGM